MYDCSVMPMFCRSADRRTRVPAGKAPAGVAPAGVVDDGVVEDDAPVVLFELSVVDEPLCAAVEPVDDGVEDESVVAGSVLPVAASDVADVVVASDADPDAAVVVSLDAAVVVVAAFMSAGITGGTYTPPPGRTGGRNGDSGAAPGGSGCPGFTF